MHEFLMALLLTGAEPPAPPSHTIEGTESRPGLAEISLRGPFFSSEVKEARDACNLAMHEDLVRQVTGTNDSSVLEHARKDLKLGVIRSYHSLGLKGQGPFADDRNTYELDSGGPRFILLRVLRNGSYRHVSLELPVEHEARIDLERTETWRHGPLGNLSILPETIALCEMRFTYRTEEERVVLRNRETGLPARGLTTSPRDYGDCLVRQLAALSKARAPRTRSIASSSDSGGCGPGSADAIADSGGP